MAKPKPKTQPKKPARQRILLVDDHAMLRRGVAGLIETDPGLMVCAEADGHQSAIKAIASAKPDLVVADLSLKDHDTDGLEMIKDIKRRFPAIPVLALSMHQEPTYAERALQAGASGYVTKDELDDKVLCAIRSVLAGEIHLGEKMSRKLALKFIAGGRIAKGAGVENLSDRELEVFKMIGAGGSTGQIARALHLSVSTVSSHRENLKIKLDLSSGAGLARAASLWVKTGSLS